MKQAEAQTIEAKGADGAVKFIVRAVTVLRGNESVPVSMHASWGFTIVCSLLHFDQLHFED